MLFDFGLAVEFDQLDNAQFTGTPVDDDNMKCLAMRQGRRWGPDFDFYGLCASAFNLLHKAHMNPNWNSKGKLSLNNIQSHPRFSKELWKNFFETLLNFDPATMEYCLGDICSEFDEYVSKNETAVEGGLVVLLRALQDES